MFIPIVPYIPHTTIINKTIVYSDTVLNVKEMGSNLKITSIDGVGKYSFQNCLETIFRSNPNVVFNTIQYSENENKVYFYTDGVVSTKEWNDKNTTRTAYSSVNLDVLNDLKDLFANPQHCDTDSISIYDVAALLRKTYFKIENIKDSYEKTMQYKVKEAIGEHYAVTIHGFDYKTGELSISLIYYYRYSNESLNNRPSAKYKFSKKDGDLYMTEEKDGGHYKDKILPLLGKNLSDIYDWFLEIENFYTQSSPRIRPLNSGFLVDIGNHGVCLFIPRDWIRKIPIGKEFQLSNYNWSNKYSCECNSNNVLEFLRGNESELFKRIFVKIDNCPDWMRDSLYERRQTQFEKEQDQKEKAAIKEKRLDLVRKIFPFIKKDS